eukprot:1140354-Pelagomonas_calceolata.AAC.3
MAASLLLLSASTCGAWGPRRIPLCLLELLCACCACTLRAGSFPRARRSCCLLAVHALYTTACVSERNWSAPCQLYTKHRSCLALEYTRKLIYVRGNSKQFIEDDLKASCTRRRTNGSDGRGRDDKGG